MSDILRQAEDMSGWLRNQAQIVELAREAENNAWAREKAREVRQVCRMVQEALVDCLEAVDE